MDRTITIAQYMATPEPERPQVKYAGELVKKIYRDPSYREIERYVIGFDFGGYGSKRPETELTIEEQGQ